MRRSALVSIFCSLLLVAATAAQQEPFKSGVSLVTVDVTVIDKDGKPVPGLTSGDFEIKLNGKAQPIRALAFIQAANAGQPPTSAAKPAAEAASVGKPAPIPAALIVAKEVDIRRTVNNQDDAAPTAPAAPVAPAAPNAPAHPAPAAPAAPATPAHQNEPRTFVILIDDLSFTAQNGRKLFAAAQRFVDRVPASDPVGFTVTSGGATVNPTIDRAAVKAGLAKVVGEWNDPRGMRKSAQGAGPEQPIGMDEAIDIDRGDDTLLKKVIIRECFGGNAPVGNQTIETLMSNPKDNCPPDVLNEAKRTAALLRQQKARQMGALTGVLNAMRIATGIRHLVYVTDGMAVQRDVNDLQPLIRTAASAGVQFSVVMEDPDGINMNATGRTFVPDAGPPQPDTGMASRMREDNKLMLNGAQTFTDMVGGIFYRVIGEADTSFTRILEASSAVYRIGVELPAGTQPGKELSLGVNVKQPGLTVRANKMAVNLPDNAPTAAAAPTAAPAGPPMITGPVAASIDDVLKAALNEDRSLRGVPMRLGAMIRRSTNADGQIDLSVNVTFPSSVKTPITALVGIVDETNALKISRRVIDNTANPAQFLFPLPAGSYAIRFGAAAADGALGTVELPIAVKLHAMGAFTSSDVMMFAVGDTSQKATLFSLDDVPPAAEKSKYFASIELYPPGAMPSEPPAVNWTITRQGETRPIVDEDSEGRVGPSLFRSDFELPFDTLPPGTYIVRATLMAGDKPAGSVAATLRKR